MFSNSEDDIEISVVIPLYNEESNIDYLFERLTIGLDNLNINYEIVCINDGSKDNTLKLLLQHHYSNPVIKVINLSRNFGKEAALSAGIDFASGAAIIPIDADLQDPPEIMGEMINKWREGYDVVYATRRSRQGDTWAKRFTANFFYRVIGQISHVQIPSNTGDFRLLDRRVVDAVKQMPERTRFMKGIFAWVGFKQTSILYDRPPRYDGITKWNYWRLWNFAIDGITSFSLLPLKVWSYVGLILSIAGFLYAAFLIVRTLLFGIDLPGYASLMVVILFLGGVQLLTLGIIGEYIGRIFEESKQRPIYLVRELYGLPKTYSLNDQVISSKK
ncbi:MULTISPECIES: glycosyltransferase family 2 protein [Moorena]|uniref:Glycosyltransferase family 2 protein n=1 Tax=Moorena producens (strain JHB) TaxID=1454205 RepID=A0A1D9G9P4_MOOP1|nr:MULTISPECIES: glycosyltransferase family 2 protein [Moorena]NEQ14380.1 glycosyltransferase family 2 protein [Moorena sp. SIO3E2]AOY84333.1 glycosyltransferase family 2 protein [Moorena producens JHB]NEP35745.1 glycosyltransferase family 2 protein [Moorena sp. SIO3B2]NEQ04527.1 glycosyltransferase family 2 protein [Moorena sp. SIO4E2]NES44412.1 glycosyltransferase family 2 protein [Moorena sp. SIO2C4]